jgi:hypothetical protein
MTIAAAGDTLAPADRALTIYPGGTDHCRPPASKKPA